MRLDQLIYLVEIAKCKSFSLAAESLHISQPNISLAINALEKELGKKLLIRSKHGTYPTEDGIFIIQKAREILNIVEEIQESTNPSSIQLKGTLKISAVPSYCMTLLPQSIVNFKTKFPNVIIELSEGGSFQIADLVRNEKIDLGFVTIEDPNLFQGDEKLIFKQQTVGKVMACVGKKSPLAAKNCLSLKEILKHPIITLPGYQMYESILKLLRKYGKPNILLNSFNRDIGRQILTLGIGVGFYSSIVIKNDPYFTTDKLVYIPISDAEINLIYGYIRLKQKRLSTPASEFLKTLKSDFSLSM